jgi:AcrR family transcriptional regulator
MDALRDAILDEALAQAEREGWENVRLRSVAGALGIPLAEVFARFRDADSVADALFARLLRAMLAPPDDPAAFAVAPPHERAIEVLWRWFRAALPHRRTVAAMLAVKAWPSHPHTWVPMVFNLSRLIHWARDTARLDRGGIARMVEEVGLTAAFLATLARFVTDTSEGAARTRRVLEAAVRRVPLG